MQKAWAYYRRSTDKQEHSIPDQRVAVEKFARENGFEIVREFVDDGVSGRGIKDREAFREMIELGSSGETSGVSLLLIYDESRFSRSDPDETAHYRYLLKQSGITVVPVTNPYAHPLVKSMNDYLSYEYSVKISQGVIRGSKSHAALGHSVGGRGAYGYDRLLVGEDGKPIRVLKPGEEKHAKMERVVLTPGDLEKVETVRSIFDLRANKGWGVKRIVNWLNERRIPSPNGGAWSVSVVWYILRNRVYIGERVYFRYHYIKMSKGKIKKLRPQSEWVVKENAHPAIIDRKTFERAQERNRLPRQQKHRSSYLLSSLITCDKCGSRFQGHAYSRGNYRYNLYVCGGYSMKGRAFCLPTFIDQETIEKHVLQGIENRVKSPAKLKRIEESLREILRAEEKEKGYVLGEVDKKIAENKRKVDNIWRAIEEGISEELAKERLERLAQERKELEEERGRLVKEKGTKINVEETVQKIMAYLDDFQGVLDMGTLEEKKDYIRHFLHNITVYPETGEAIFSWYKVPEYQEKILTQCSHPSAASTLPKT